MANYSEIRPDELLHHVKIPDYTRAIEHPRALEKVASALYDKPIEKARIDPFFSYRTNVKRVNAGRRRIFYIKESYEGAVNEALGMSLSNLLVDTQFTYVFHGNTMAIDEVRGSTINKVESDHLNEHPEAYGEALELARALNLGDRLGINIILTDDGRIVNIDFGKLYSGMTLQCKKPRDDRKIAQGEELAKRKIATNIDKRCEELIATLRVGERLGGSKAIAGATTLNDYLSSRGYPELGQRLISGVRQDA